MMMRGVQIETGMGWTGIVVVVVLSLLTLRALVRVRGARRGGDTEEFFHGGVFSWLSRAWWAWWWIGLVLLQFFYFYFFFYHT